jgi:hypothetical protein
LSKWFQSRRFLWEFPIGSYVKLSSAVAAISVGSLKCRIQFWKGTTQGSSEQSLVEIGSVVSEENILFKFHPPFFLFLAWWPSWLKVGITGYKFGRGLSKDHSTKVWFELTQWFLKRRFLCEFPKGFYVKLGSAVGAILVEGPNCRTHFWTWTIKWLFHPNLVLIEQMVSDLKIFMGISYRVLC